MKKSKVILSIVSTVLISSTLLNTNVFADVKKGIRELVMEHEFKISELEEQVRNVSIETTPLSEEMKETLIKEYLYRLEDLLIDRSDADRIKKMNLVNYKLVEKNGENV